MVSLNFQGKDAIRDYHTELPVCPLVVDDTLSFPHGTVESEKQGLSRGNNLIIQGDNLLSLKALMSSYESQVRCIYIDPPYNTGNGGWCYNDNVRSPVIQSWLSDHDGLDPNMARHDKWLCMMWPRLALMRDLLASNGALFVSIDDHEYHRLRLILDELFGAENFVTSMPWQSRRSVQNDTDISVSHEYVLVYAKNRRQTDRRLKVGNADAWEDTPAFAMYPLPLETHKFSNPDDDPRGPWKADPFDAPNLRPNLTYPIENPQTGETFWPPEGRCWRTDPQRFQELLAEGRIVFGKQGTARPQLKVFYEEKKDFGRVATTWLEGKNVGTATAGTKECMALFDGKRVFDYPKPTALIKHLLRLSTRGEDIVLDAFAGSGTTAQAVWELNQEDGGNRRFILLESEAYAQTVTAERVRRAMSEESLPKNPNSTFYFYRLQQESDTSTISGSPTSSKRRRPSALPQS